MARRSAALNLDFEASGFLTTEAERLNRLFPKSKFILTIRPTESWLHSMLRHIQKNRQNLGYHYWEPVLEHYFTGHQFPREEATLEAKKLFPLRAILEYWRQSNESVIRSIPKDKLLILHTKKLSKSLGQLEHFMGWKPHTLNPQQSHLHQSPSTKGPIYKINEQYLSTLTSDYDAIYEQWLKD